MEHLTHRTMLLSVSAEAQMAVSFISMSPFTPLDFTAQQPTRQDGNAYIIKKRDSEHSLGVLKQ